MNAAARALVLAAVAVLDWWAALCVDFRFRLEAQS